ncbi:hypothetical protein [Nesterenkonia sp. K-15-9-6]|uniref:hypothetical protein n=1 Tax=Nesterenkonia sp. K-15-9-6 TaxID=3093918 RepID=UPI004044C6F0
MPHTVPLASENADVQPDLQLWLGVADSPANQSARQMIHDAHNISVSYGDGSDHNGLRFTVFKDSPLVEQLAEDGWDWEVIVRWWDPRRGKWLEPPNSRFIILDSDEDMADESNRITYTCVGTTWLLEKVRVRVREQYNDAWRLNRDVDRAQEDYNTAQSDYESLVRQFESRARTVQEGHWPDLSHGPVFAVRGVTWTHRQGRARWRSIVSDVQRGGSLWWLSFDRGKFVRLSMDTGTTAVQNAKADMVDLGPQVRAARVARDRARSALAAAERAARESSRNGTRFFYNRTPGRLLSMLWIEACDRDAGHVNHGETTPGWPDSPYPRRTRILKGIYRGWTTTRDSKNRLWTGTTPRRNWELRLGQTYWSVIQDFRQRGILDWRMGGPVDGGGGRTLQLVPHGDLVVDQTRRVGLRLGTEVIEAPQKVSQRDHQTVTFVLTSQGLNRYTFWGRDNPEQQTPWGLWEGSMNEAEATDLQQALDLTAEERRERANRYTIDASRRVHIHPAGPLPMLDYEPHHMVTVYDHDGDHPRQVSQIIVEKPGGEAPMTATIRLGTRRTSEMISYARTVNRMLGEADAIQGHIPIDPALAPSEVPQGALSAPEITSMGANVRFNEEGRPRVVVSAAVSAAEVPEPEDAELFDEAEDVDDWLDDEEYDGD